jgi:hydrogenase maturation protease
MHGKVLIACVGNIFLGDDAFGVEVAQQLARTTLSENVIVRDYGIRSYDLAYALMEEWDLVVLVDAVSRGEQPGTIFTIEPDLSGAIELNAAPDAHSMNPASVIQLVRALGGPIGEKAGRMLVVGCEPAGMEADENGQIGLSEPVQAAIPEAVLVIQKLVAANTKAIAA